MEKRESEPTLAKDKGRLFLDESPTGASENSKIGGWKTFPFLIGSTLGLVLATAGVLSNFIVYLIREFNVKSIQATQIANIVNGCTNLTPIVGAIISDSLFSCFSVITISIFASLLGTVLLTLTATIRSLKPKPCTTGSQACEPPSASQFAILYVALALVAIGNGGTRFTMLTMGANQYVRAKDQEIFFNWFFIVMYIAAVVSATAIVYLQDNAGWGWGFGICAGANFVSLVVFLLGKRRYKHVKPNGSPFTAMARVTIAAIRKVQTSPSTDGDDYFHGCGKVMGKGTSLVPTSSVRFLNRAAFKIQGDTHCDGSLAKPWRLCTVEQVEDFKTIIKIIPLWSTSILLSTSIGVQASLTVLQALTMDRHLSHHFSIPASSFLVTALLASVIALSIFDRVLYPTYRILTHRTPTPLQRIGVGHLFNILSMATSALIESRRLSVIDVHDLAHLPGAIVPMSALWLIPQLVLVGIGEAFHFPGQANLYYQEFPVSMRSTATGVIALLIGIGFYLSTAMVDVTRKVTGWLPDNTNEARMDNVYWMLTVLGALNFGYYLLCSKLYVQRSVEEMKLGQECVSEA